MSCHVQTHSTKKYLTIHGLILHLVDIYLFTARNARNDPLRAYNHREPLILSFCFHNTAGWSETKAADLFLRGTAINSRESSSSSSSTKERGKFHNVVFLLAREVTTSTRWSIEHGRPSANILIGAPSKILAPLFYSRLPANSILAPAAVAPRILVDRWQLLIFGNRERESILDY